jgi:hypothetical protein
MCEHCMNRREFGAFAAAGVAGSMAGLSSVAAADSLDIDAWDPDQPPAVTGGPLVVQPVLAYQLMPSYPKTSWRSWSDIISEPAAAEEAQRIAAELKRLSAEADFKVEFLPLAKVTGAEQAARVQKGEFDVVLAYTASNYAVFPHLWAKDPRRDTLVFARHESGPAYFGYEYLGVQAGLKVPSPELWQGCSTENHGGVTLDDVVIDDYGEILWRLRALYGLKNFVGQRIVALGGPQGKWDATAPDVARKRYKLEIIDATYPDLAARLKAIAADAKVQARLAAWTDRFLAMPHTTLETKREFVHRAFGLYVVFRQWLREHNATAITINACMGTILGASDTTACMPLMWLNDEGRMAFCESDFVCIPAGILLHYISGKPVFLHNSTFPHKAVVTCAHCTAPRRMDGKRYEPIRVMTHYESDFGAAPKVEMPIGQQVSAISPEYAKPRWVGIRGTVRKNPCMPICRSQQDVQIQGAWKRLIRGARNSHWMMVYGDYLREIGYAAHKIGLTWDNVSDAGV